MLLLVSLLFLINVHSSFQQYPQLVFPQQQHPQQVYGPQLPQYYVQQQQQLVQQISPQSSLCSYMPNIDYYGNDLPGSPCPARSIEECCALCQNNPHCQAWTFVCDPNPDCSTCFLKSCVGSDIRCVPNRYSGVKALVATTTCAPNTPSASILCSVFYIC